MSPRSRGLHRGKSKKFSLSKGQKQPVDTALKRHAAGLALARSQVHGGNMPALSGQPALDVAIGLFFTFFVLSVLCSAINELIASAFAWRSATLLKALRSMLADGQKLEHRSMFKRWGISTNPELAKALVDHTDANHPERMLEPILDHPIVRSLASERSWMNIRRSVPSYLPSRTFSRALLDTVTDDALADDNAFTTLESAIDALPNAYVKKALQSILKDARGDVDKFRTGVETWFDSTMERASGWYKRRTQIWLLIISAVVVIATNADSGTIATALWKDPQLRGAVVTQAQTTVAGTAATTPTTPPTATTPTTVTTTTSVGAPAVTTPTSPSQAEQVQKAREAVVALGLPLGWGAKPDDPRRPRDDFGWWFAKLLGLAATIIALSLGAPFWFDLLGKATGLRGSGEKPAAKT
jgi:hypothetical protein